MSESTVAVGKKVGNIVSYGTVVQTKIKTDGQYIRAKVLDRLTPWLKVKMPNSPLIKVWIPMQAGEQVEILHAGGELDKGTASHVGRGKPFGAAQNNIILEMFGIIIKISDGKVKVHSDLEVCGNLSVKGNSIVHQGINVGNTHTHGYEGASS